jgi:classical protein kinase C/novel protein kinase C epsilon type
MEQYECLTLLGAGYSWKVFVSRIVHTARLYAVRERRKQKIVEFDEMTNLQRELETLQALSETKHPHLINLVDVFHTRQAIYFVTDFMSGGDLEYLLERRPLLPEQTRIFAAELCLAIKHLHEHDIVHRNIRLDNILIADDGRIVLSGFGTCRPGMAKSSRSSSFVGGGDCMPPEVLLDEEYGRSVDWWAYGIVLYQMMLRQAPFTGDSADEIYDAILTKDPQYPSTLPTVCIDVLRRLLERDPRQRLGSGEADALEVMQHAYFNGIVWDDIMLKPIEASHQAIVNIETVLGNFRDEHTRCCSVLPRFDNLTDPSTILTSFHDFDFLRLAPKALKLDGAT